MAPPVAAHLVADDAGNQRTQTAVLCNECVPAAAANVKKAAVGMAGEPMHGNGAVDRIENDFAETRRAIRERLKELPHSHVVVGEALDQDDGAIFFGKAEFADRDAVANDPGADRAAERKAKRQDAAERMTVPRPRKPI